MNHALAAPMPRAGLRLAQVLRGLPYAVYMVVIAAVLACGLAIATMRSPSAPRAAQQPNAVTFSAGVVEGIRMLEATGNLPNQFEFTVRMRDGSTRVSRTTGRGQWHAGDRILLMTGARATGA